MADNILLNTNLRGVRNANWVSTTDKTVQVSVDGPEPLVAIARVLKSIELPRQQTLKLVGILFTAYKIHQGFGNTLVDILQDFIELFLFYVSGYSIRLVAYERVSVPFGANSNVS